MFESINRIGTCETQDGRQDSRQKGELGTEGRVHDGRRGSSTGHDVVIWPSYGSLSLLEMGSSSHHSKLCSFRMLHIANLGPARSVDSRVDFVVGHTLVALL